MQPQLRAADAWLEARAGLNAGGVQALLAKHWRVNSVAPMSLAHAQLSWDNRVPVADPLLTIEQGVEKYPFFNKWSLDISKQNPSFVNWITKFYQDWAKANFGPERSDELGALLALADRLGESHQIRNGIKGGIPKVAQWLPSSITEFWLDEGDIVDYTDPTFVDAMHVYTEFCSYKDDIVGTGNKDRYMYWYHFFQSQLELSKLVCHEYHYRNEDPRTDARKDSILNTWANVMSHEIQRVRNESELGIIAQLQQSTWGKLFRGEYGITEFDTDYKGENAVRAMPEITQVYENETFSQKVIFIGNGTITSPTMYYREIGDTGTFSTVALSPVSNSENVMKAELADPGYDFEYYIQGRIGSDTVTYPATGGIGVENINKTVITIEKMTYTPQELTPYVPPPAYNLTANVDPEQGSVALDPPGGLYSEGTTVSIKATAEPGYIFDGWSGDLSGSNSTASLTMDDNKSVTAIFISDPTSLPNANSENSVLFYPSPVEDKLTVETAGRLEEIRIYSTMGELLFHENNPTGIISMDRFARGMYIIEAKTNGNTFFNKVIKQ
ncbi:MAG: T9SS type A sorting domain-containing protein [Bacteroidales bacterium]|nr:T9SS type A sorting domain-containing protein [Bacteroidales bacterium]